MADTDDRVELTDLDVISRYSLAVRAATADRDELIATLRADLEWLQGGRNRRAAPAASRATSAAPAVERPRRQEPAPAPAVDRRAPAVRKASAKKAAAVRKAAPAKNAAPARKTTAKRATAKKATAKKATAKRSTGRR